MTKLRGWPDGEVMGPEKSCDVCGGYPVKVLAGKKDWPICVTCAEKALDEWMDEYQHEPRALCP